MHLLGRIHPKYNGHVYVTMHYVVLRDARKSYATTTEKRQKS